MSILSEIKRRNVFRVALAYAAITWLLVQLATTVEEPLNLPAYFDTLVIVLLAIGFPVALVIAWAFELTPQGIKPTASVAPEASITPWTGRKLSQITIAVLAMAVVLLLFDRFILEQQSDVLPNSIAVLPFESHSLNENDAYFARSLRDEFSNQLSKIQNLIVIGEATMSRYQNTTKTHAEIADELNVEALLTASVSFAEGEVAINARLLDPRADRSIWSDALVYPFENVFMIRSEIAMYVANAMLVEYSEEEQRRIQESATGSGEAYALYLAALDPLREGTADGASRAIELLNEALAIDETYVDAWSLKASAHRVSAFYAGDDEQRQHQSLEAEAIEKTLSLDPDHPQALRAHAGLLLASGDLIGAYREYLKARELAGSAVFSVIPLSLGYLEQSVVELEEAWNFDPLNPEIYALLIRAHDALDNSDDARYWFDRASALGVRNPGVDGDYLAFLLGNAEQDEIRRFDWQGRADVRAWLETIDDREFLSREIRALHSANSTTIDQAWIAIFAAYIGDTELALDPFADGYATFSRVWTQLNREVRKLPRFKEVMLESGLVDVWKEYHWPELCEPLEGDDFVCR